MTGRYLLWLGGTVRISIQGKERERFLNICRRKRIAVWGLIEEKNIFFAWLKLADFWGLKEIREKTHVRIHVQQRRGFPFWIKKQGRRKGVVCGVCSGVLLVFYLSSFVWDINISGQQIISQEALLTYLSSEGISPGMKISKVNCAEINEKIRGRYQNISWVSTKISGSKIYISLVETKLQKVEEGKKRGTCIVSPASGIVKKMVTRSGTPLVVEGEKVKKKDILIAGYLDMKDEEEESAGKKLVCAEGNVWVEHSLEQEFTIDYNYLEKVYEEKNRKISELILGNYKIFLINPLKRFNKRQKYDIISSEYSLFLTKAFVLPIRIKQMEYKAYSEKEARYTRKDAKSILLSRLHVIRKKLQERCVVEKEVMVWAPRGDKLQLKVRFLLLEKAEQDDGVNTGDWRKDQIHEFDGVSGRSSDGT